jgi:hypothetical protein
LEQSNSADAFHPDKCPSNREFRQGRLNWLSISLLLLAIFSTIFSGIFLVIGLSAPRWGKSIQTNGHLSPSGANILTQLFAKMIEMSFVAVFVTFLGQVISRRAISSKSRGITLAELGMRNWILQPGTIITHYETVRFAALTILGSIALIVAILATLYSTAASALGKQHGLTRKTNSRSCSRAQIRQLGEPIYVRAGEDYLCKFSVPGAHLQNSYPSRKLGFRLPRTLRWRDLHDHQFRCTVLFHLRPVHGLLVRSHK